MGFMLNWDLPPLLVSFLLFLTNWAAQPHSKFIKALFSPQYNTQSILENSRTMWEKKKKKDNTLFGAHRSKATAARCCFAPVIWISAHRERKKNTADFTEKHPLKPQSPCLLTETKTTASKFPREAAWRSLPFASEKPPFWMCFSNKLPCSHLVVTWRTRTSRCTYRAAHLLSEHRCLAYFPPRLWAGQGGWGWRLSSTTEWNDCCWLFFTVLDRYFPTVQTGRYGYNNRGAHSSCPFFSLPFVYPGSHSLSDMCTCGQDVCVCVCVLGVGVFDAQLRFLQVNSREPYSADFLLLDLCTLSSSLMINLSCFSTRKVISRWITLWTMYLQLHSMLAKVKFSSSSQRTTLILIYNHVSGQIRPYYQFYVAHEELIINYY